MGWISETSEMISKRFIEPAVEAGAKLIGRGGKAAAEKGLEKLEPTIAKAGDAVRPKLTADETKAFLEKSAKETADKKAAEEAAQKAANPKLTPEETKAFLEKSAKETAEKQAAEKEAAAGLKPGEAGKAGGKTAADETIKTAATGERLSLIEARKIAKSDDSLTSKLRDLTNGGRIDWAKRVVADARFKGMAKGDIDDVLQESSRAGSKIPKELVAELQKSHNIKTRGWFFERWAEKGAATVNYLGSRTKEALTNPISFVATGYDLLAAQWRAPIGALKVAKNSPVKTLGVAAVALPTFAVVDHATDGTLSTLGGKATSKIVNTYGAVDSGIINYGFGIGTSVVGALTSKTAAEVAKATGEKMDDAAGKVPGMMNNYFTGMLGEDPVTFLERNPLVGAVVPKGWSATLKADKLRREEKGNGTMAQTPGNETGVTPPAPAAAASGDKKATEKTPEQQAEDSLSDDEKTEYSKMSKEEKKKYIGERATAFLKSGKDAGKKAIDAVEDALDDGQLAKLNKLPTAGLFGALFGFDKNKGLKGSFGSMLGLGTLFTLIWDKIGPAVMSFFGGGHGGRAGYDRHNRDMADTQRVYAEMRGNAGFAPQGIYGPQNQRASQGGIYGPPAAQQVSTQGPAAAGVYGPPRRDGIDQGNGVTTYPVQAPGVSVAQSVNGPAIQTPVDPKTAAAQASLDNLVQKVDRDNQWASNKVSEVTNVAGTPTYTYGPATPAPAAAPVVQVNGIERSYGTPNPNISDETRKKAQQQVQLQPEALSMN